jgi:hypothetical protein
MGVALCSPEKNLQQMVQAATPITTVSSNLVQPVSYDSLDESVKKALEFYQCSADSKYKDFTFHLDSTFSTVDNKVRFDLTAEYRGETPFSDEVRLTYLVCGAFNRGDGWRSMCFPPPRYTTLPEKDKKPVQPGEIIHQTVEITYSPERLQNVGYLVPHVDIFFKSSDEPQTRVGVFFKK